MSDKIPMSPSRMDSTAFLTKNLKSYVNKNSNVLDVGFGKLFFLNLLKDLNFEGKYTGVDILKTPRISKLSFKSTLIQGDFIKYKVKSDFNFAVCLWVLEHIQKDDEAIEKIYLSLKPGSNAIIAVPSIWSWPFEFGRHGYHYYSKSKILNMCKNSKFKIVKTYSSGGLFGFIFMIFYNWIRFAVLIISIPFYILIKNTINKKLNWKSFSKNVIDNSVYLYHKSPYLLDAHNRLITKIVSTDKEFKIFPASYILVLKK